DQIRILQEIIQHMKSPRRFKKLTSLLHPEWSRLTQDARTDQGEPREVEHFEAVLQFIETRLMRENLCKRWDRQMEGLAAPRSQDVGPKPEETMAAYGAQLEKAVTWMDEHWGRLKAEMAEVGLKWELLFKRLPLKPHQETEALRIVDLIRDQLIPLTGKHVANLEIKGLKDRRTQWLKVVRSVDATEVSRPLLKTLEQAFKAIDYDAYDKAWKRLAQVLELKPAYDERQRILDQLAQVAPHWVEAIQQRQALNGWLGLYRKIGKGTGKLVGKFKDEARRVLLECHQAVPVWIMPLSRALESFELGTITFDVIIVDEASQCDVLGLAAFGLAKKVVVIGDHEQVSPYAIGFEVDRVQGLIDEFLDGIPNKQLYDGKTSVYDL